MDLVTVISCALDRQSISTITVEEIERLVSLVPPCIKSDAPKSTSPLLCIILRYFACNDPLIWKDYYTSDVLVKLEAMTMLLYSVLKAGAETEYGESETSKSHSALAYVAENLNYYPDVRLVIGILLAYDANPNVYYYANRDQPQHFLKCEHLYGSLYLIKLLHQAMVKHGLDINYKVPGSNKSILQLSCMHQLQTEEDTIIKYLISKGVDPNTKLPFPMVGSTSTVARCLFRYIHEGKHDYLDLVAYLVEQGATLNNLSESDIVVELRTMFGVVAGFNPDRFEEAILFLLNLGYKANKIIENNTVLGILNNSSHRPREQGKILNKIGFRCFHRFRKQIVDAKPEDVLSIIYENDLTRHLDLVFTEGDFVIYGRLIDDIYNHGLYIPKLKPLVERIDQVLASHGLAKKVSTVKFIKLGRIRLTI